MKDGGQNSHIPPQNKAVQTPESLHVFDSVEQEPSTISVINQHQIPLSSTEHARLNPSHPAAGSDANVSCWGVDIRRVGR